MNEECCVCFEKLWIVNTPCNHHICLDCLLKLKNDECPLCRSKLISKLPKKVKTFFKINDNKLNIFDRDEFPSLSDHPFS